MYDADGRRSQKQRRSQPGAHRGRQLKAHFADSDYYLPRRLRWCTNWMKAFQSTESSGNEQLTASRSALPGLHRRLQARRLLEPVILSILLGIVEGLTEFLPVSSTAHLRIAEALMKIPLGIAAGRNTCLTMSLLEMYTIVIQVGAILALCLLFLERIVNFLRTFPRGENGDRTWLNHPISLTLHRLRMSLRFPHCCCANGARKTSAASQPWPSRCSWAAS